MTFTADVQRFIVRSAQRIVAWVRRVRSQPGWVMRAAMTAFLIVIAVPIVLLVMFALLVGIAVFAVLASANILASRIRRHLPRRDGRENVRVIRRVGE